MDVCDPVWVWCFSFSEWRPGPLILLWFCYRSIVGNVFLIIIWQCQWLSITGSILYVSDLVLIFAFGWGIWRIHRCHFSALLLFLSICRICFHSWVLDVVVLIIERNWRQLFFLLVIIIRHVCVPLALLSWFVDVCSDLVGSFCFLQLLRILHSNRVLAVYWIFCIYVRLSHMFFGCV